MVVKETSMSAWKKVLRATWANTPETTMEPEKGTAATITARPNGLSVALEGKNSTLNAPRTLFN